jgi:predicted 3-demethylubiquinone-9 3-methyltransferase (glyoxalase superfamily)
MQRITPFLWFDGKAEEAIKLYTSVFKNSKIIKNVISRQPFPENQVMTGDQWTNVLCI